MAACEPSSCTDVHNLSEWCMVQREACTACGSGLGTLHQNVLVPEQLLGIPMSTILRQGTMQSTGEGTRIIRHHLWPQEARKGQKLNDVSTL